jgi:hypothetical protein
MLSGYEALNLFTTSFAGVPLIYERIHASFQPWLVLLAPAVALVVALKGPRTLKPRATLSLGSFLLMLIILLESCFTPTTLSANHLLLIYPFPALLIANSAVLVWDVVRQRAERDTSSQTQLANARPSVTRLGVAVLLAVVLAGNLLTVIQNHRVLKSTGGVGMWSTAIYDLANYLDEHPRQVSALDWGLDLNLLMLDKGKASISNDWRKFLYPSPESAEMQALLRDRDRVFLLHSPKYAGVLAITKQDYPRETLFRTASELGLSLQCLRTFQQNDGEPLYEVYAVAH